MNIPFKLAMTTAANTDCEEKMMKKCYSEAEMHIKIALNTVNQNLVWYQSPYFKQGY